MASNGAFSLNRTGATEHLFGSVSPDGSFFSAGPGTVLGSHVMLWVGCRK